MVNNIMGKVLYSLLVSALAGLSTMFGSVFIFFKGTDKKILISSLAFAAGVMICVSITDLLPSSFEMIGNIYRFFPCFLVVMIFMILGVIFSMLIDKYLPDNKYSDNNLYRVGLISMLAIILHNIPEGIATYMASTTDLKLGITLAIAISLHNIPEGISISVPIYYATGSRFKSLWYTFISGISEFFGAVLALVFLSRYINDVFMGCLFAVIAGIMLHISFYELLPTSFSYKNIRFTLLFCLLGFLFMFLSHIISI